MIILYYDIKKETPDSVREKYEYIKEITNEDVIALPNSYDVLLNVSKDQIRGIINILEKAINE